MPNLDTAHPWLHPLGVAGLPRGRVTAFLLTPDAELRQAIAAATGILHLRKLRFEGTLSPVGKHDWQLTAKLGATAAQSCVVTLDRVTTRLDEVVDRSYVNAGPNPDPAPGPETETEIPSDDTVENLGTVIDPGQVMVEALMLALPQFPRAPGASLAQSRFSKPGSVPMTDADMRPFAALKTLRDGRKNDSE